MVNVFRCFPYQINDCFEWLFIPLPLLVLRNSFYKFEAFICAHQQLFNSGLLVRAAIQNDITLKFKRNTNNGGGEQSKAYAAFRLMYFLPLLVLRNSFYKFEAFICAHQQLFNSGLLVRAAIQNDITLKFKRNTNNGGGEQPKAYSAFRLMYFVISLFYHIFAFLYVIAPLICFVFSHSNVVQV